MMRTECPAYARSMALASPPGPAPMITISAVSDRSLSLRRMPLSRSGGNECDVFMMLFSSVRRSTSGRRFAASSLSARGFEDEVGVAAVLDGLLDDERA